MRLPLLDRMVYVRPDQLRSGWRIALFLLAGFAASNVAVPLFAMALPVDALPWTRPSLECLAVLFGTRYACVNIDKRGWAAVGLGPDAWRPSLVGVGALTVSLPMALTFLRNWQQADEIKNQQQLRAREKKELKAATEELAKSPTLPLKADKMLTGYTKVVRSQKPNGK